MATKVLAVSKPQHFVQLRRPEAVGGQAGDNEVADAASLSFVGMRFSAAGF